MSRSRLALRRQEPPARMQCCESCGLYPPDSGPGRGWITLIIWLCPRCAEPQPWDAELLALFPLPLPQFRSPDRVYGKRVH